MIKENAAHNGHVPPHAERKPADDQGHASLGDDYNTRGNNDFSHLVRPWQVIFWRLTPTPSTITGTEETKSTQ